MSILIKGMKMPKDGYIDVRLFSDGWAHIPTDEPPYYNRAFEAAELPPHGRLIDADALIDEAYQPGAYGYVDAIQIENAPTIIPADGGADG